MRHSRSFTIALFLVFYLLSPICYWAEATDIPRLELTKTSFTREEDITVRYFGVPTFLQASLTDERGNNIDYTAVLKEDRDGQYMDFRTANPLKPGSYALKIWKDNDKLVDTPVFWGVKNDSAPVTGTSDKPVITRTAPSRLTAGKMQTVTLQFTADKDISGQLIERVPFDSIVEATDAAQIKNPELLSLRMPFDGDYEMTAPFGTVNPAEHLGLSQHDGVDFATPMGTPVYAVDDGEVVPYREVNHYGITQAIQHSWGTTFYGHLSTTSAQIGQKVKKGQKIGISGNTGLSTGPHLHFGMKWNDDFVNGLPYISRTSDKSFDVKEIVWNIEAKKGDKITKTYTMVMPEDKTYLEDLSLGPAQTVDDNQKPLMQEEKDWSLKLDIPPSSITSASLNF